MKEPQDRRAGDRRAGRRRDLGGRTWKRLIDPPVDDQVPRREPVQGQPAHHRDEQRDHRGATWVPADRSSGVETTCIFSAPSPVLR